jgi:hypothetical protein
MRLNGPIWLSMNSPRVCTFALGNAPSDFSRAAWFASVSPPCIVRNEKTFFGAGTCRSHATVEIVTRPNGDPPVGGSKTPLIRNVTTCPFGNVILTGEPSRRLWSLA